MKKISQRSLVIALASVALFILVACSSDNPKMEACRTDYETALTQGTCIMQIALEKETERSALKICDQIDNGVEDTCIRNVAVKFNDKPLCFENENEIETYVCLSNLAEKNQDTSICKEITRKKDEDFCYRKVAVATLDASVCDNIVDNDEFKQICLESVKYSDEFKESQSTSSDPAATESQGQAESAQ